MSSYAVVAEVNRALRDLLWREFETEDQIKRIINSKDEIVFKNPTETARDSANRLSLWLYQIVENEHVKNQPMLRDNGHTSTRFPPLALNLFYLITPFAPTGDPSAQHRLLGKTMQVLYDYACFELQIPEEDIAEELRIIFCRLTLEELTRIWDALREPYRLSVCYEVRVTRIDSQRTSYRERVIDRVGRFDDDPSQARSETT